MMLHRLKRIDWCFLPIIILLLLSCPAKREIKRLLELPVASTAMSKSIEKDKVATCELQNKTVKKRSQGREHLCATTPSAFYSYTPSYIFTLSPLYAEAPDEPVLTERFIRFRKLII